jgi:predicted naringenin-chalcone synthase
MLAVFLNQFQVIKPQNCLSQDKLLNWIIKCHQLADKQKLNNNQKEKIDPELIKKLFERYGVKSSQISQRYFECNDICAETFDNNTIYSIDELTPNGKNITEKAIFFAERSYQVLEQFYSINLPSLPKPNHLIHVTCTGYISPSAAQQIVSQPAWQQQTDITHAYHMGCYASLPATRLAKSLVVSENSTTNNQFRVDIVHNEMCGLHMNCLAHTPEQMIVQTLFADGHIKYTASAQAQKKGFNLKIIALHEKIISNSQMDMSWISAPWGMQMNLSREVPAKIKLELKEFSSELFSKANLTKTEVKEAIFAIHPGGTKIIDSVKEVLELTNSQISETQKVLFERGNMSSATLPHVWEEILNRNYPIGTKIISYAFGPGLTLFGSVFEIS